MKAGRHRQRGIALILVMLVLALGGTWYMVNRLNALSLNHSAADKVYNARVLNRAKQALIGYVAAQAAKGGAYPEPNPGSLPCPENPGDFDSTTGREGLAGTSCGSSLKVGRFPWRGIGSEQFKDASGEPLWYVVSTSWGLPTAGNSIVNSDSTGGLTLDGTANAAVALIIAPGPAVNVTASSGCTAWSQNRPTSGNPDWRNYLECENASSPADVTFVTSSTNAAFNDQVVAITAADLLPGIEAAVAGRFERDFAPRLRSWVFTSRTATKSSGATALTVSSTRGMEVGDTIGIQLNTGAWGWTTISAVTSGTALTLAANALGTASGSTFTDVMILRPKLPFAASLPVSAATTYEGVSGQSSGLFPSSYSTTGACSTPPCTPAACNSATDSRCQPGFVTWRDNPAIVGTGGASVHNSSACHPSGTPSVLTCTVYISTTLFGFTTTADFYVDTVANNVGMALRQVNPTVVLGGVDTSYNSPYGYAVSNKTINGDGSAGLRISTQVSTGATVVGALSGITCSITIFGFTIPLCYSYTVTIPVAMFSDHPVVDPSNTDYDWFTRNNWHQLAYYAVAPGYLPSGAGSCTTSSTCLQVNYHTDSSGVSDAGKPRGVMILGGRALTGQVRPANAVTDLLEGANADGASPFEARSATLQPNRGFNDRFAVIDSN